MEAGLVIFLLCLLVIAVGFVTGYISARRPRKADPVDARFVQCSGECGTRLALVGHKPQFGECVFCAKCWLKTRTRLIKLGANIEQFCDAMKKLGKADASFLSRRPAEPPPHSEVYEIPWPEGMNWWAIDSTGYAWFFTHKPVVPDGCYAWVVPEPEDYNCFEDRKFKADEYPLMFEHWRASLHKRGGV